MQARHNFNKWNCWKVDQLIPTLRPAWAKWRVTFSGANVRAAEETIANDHLNMWYLMKVYDGEPLHVLFKFSGAQATRMISRAQLPFWSQCLFYFKFAVWSALTQESQLELEIGPSESSPPSQSESAARLLPDSAALTSEIFMTPPKL